MAVELIIQSNEYLNQFTNGATYATNTSDVTYNLAGTVMEKLQYTTTIDVSWKYVASTSNPLFWEDLGSDLFRFKKGAGTWTITDGFAIGDDVDWYYVTGSTANTIDGDITIISGDWMYVQFTTTPTNLLPATDGESTSSIMYGKSTLSSLIYSFGLIGNNETFNTDSKVSGNNQAYYVSALVVATPQTMTKQGSHSDWITGSITCEKIANPSTYVQRYELIHNFIINPYYLDGELSDLTSNTIPNLYSGGNSLKHVVKVDLRTGLSDPNTSKIATMDSILGSTGYFGENFNGFNNDYAVDSTTYENVSAVSADGILTAEETTIRCTISKSSGSFVSTDKIGAYVSLLPGAAQYTDTTTDFETNFIYDNLHCLADGTPVTQASSFIDEVSATVSGGDILLVIKTTLSTAQQVYLATLTDPYFLLAIQCGDITLSNVSSDRVMLVADALPFDTSADISGLITVNNMTYFTHDMDSTTDVGFTTLATWNEDGVVMNFDFDLDLNNDALLNSLEVVVVAADATTGVYFELDSYEFQLGNIISGGVQQFNISDTRGYTLATSSNFNNVSLTTGSQAGGLQNYICTIGQKISWQEWIQNLDVASVFYDSAEPNNNFNDKTSNYANLTDNHVIKLGIKANVYGSDSTLGTTGNTDYIAYAGNITTFDYDEDADSPSPRFTATIETFTEDGVTNLGGALLTNGDNTLVKTTWVDNLYSFVSVWNYYGIHRLEPVNAQGYSIEEFSSITTPPTGQVLQPTSGNTLLDMQIVSGDLVTESLVDGSNQNININYKLSSRLQTPNRNSTLDLITFYHTNDVATALSMAITKSGATTQWDYGDGSAIDTANSISHTFPTSKETYLITANVDDFDDITVWDSDDDQVTGNFDWSDLTNVTNFTLSNSAGLGSITNPTTATVMTNYDVQGSGMTTLDVSGLTGLGGIFDCNASGNLTSIVVPASTQTFSLFTFYDCDVAFFDLTPLTNLTEATSVYINLGNNSLTAAEVNQFLVDLDSMSTNGFATRTIKIDGTNAAPDGSSGGYDGTTAKASLVAKTFTVTTN